MHMSARAHKLSVPKHKTEADYLIRGIAFGSVLAICVAILLYATTWLLCQLHWNPWFGYRLWPILLSSCVPCLIISIPCMIILKRYYVKKNRQKARKILASFVKVEVKLALTIMSEGWDFATY